MTMGDLGFPKPVAQEALPLVRDYYAKPGNKLGGNLHMVLDDGRVEDVDVELCLAQAQEAGDEEGERLARLILGMSRTQRLKLFREISATPWGRR